MMNWIDAEFRHHTDLQAFTCATLPYRKAKKLDPSAQVRSKVWASFVQGSIRNLRPPAATPDKLLLGQTKESQTISALYHSTDLAWDNKVLYVALNLIGVTADSQGRGFGQETLNRFMSDAGSRARNFGCSRLEIVATVHNGNASCHALIERNGWEQLGPAAKLADCTKWGIAGELDLERPLSITGPPLPLIEADVTQQVIDQSSK